MAQFMSMARSAAARSPGATGNGDARIFCRKFEAELVAIDGSYLTAERCAPELIGKAVQIRLTNDAIV